MGRGKTHIEAGSGSEREEKEEGERRNAFALRAAVRCFFPSTLNLWGRGAFSVPQLTCSVFKLLLSKL